MDVSWDRSRQPATSRGLRAHFTSPQKKRPGKRRTQVMAMTTFDAPRKRQHLQAELEALLATELPVVPEAESELMDGGGPSGVADELQVEGLLGQDSLDPTTDVVDSGFDYGFHQPHSQDSAYPDNKCSGTHALIPTKEPQKRVTPDQATTVLYEKWKESLPLLVDELLSYQSASVGAAIQPVGSELQGRCCLVDVKTSKVTVLYF